LCSLLIWALIFLFIYRCPFKWITGIDCPACGTSRAFICILKGDFKTAFCYHPLYPILAMETAYYVLVYTLEFKKLKLKSKIETVVSIITSILLLFVWVIKICF